MPGISRIMTHKLLRGFSIRYLEKHKCYILFLIKCYTLMILIPWRKLFNHLSQSLAKEQNPSKQLIEFFRFRSCFFLSKIQFIKIYDWFAIHFYGLRRSQDDIHMQFDVFSFKNLLGIYTLTVWRNCVNY